MSIYLANCTTQKLRHQFRIPESDRISILDIYSGQQEVIDPENKLSVDQIDHIINHLEIFGFRNASDARGKLSDFSGFLYRVGKSVGSDDILMSNEQRTETLQKRSADEAVKSALGYDREAQNKSGKRGRGAKVTGVDIEQIVPPRERLTGEEIKMSITVSPDGQDRL